MNIQEQRYDKWFDETKVAYQQIEIGSIHKN